MDRLHVALVGAGPKGLFALERLLDHLAKSRGGTSVKIDVLEPHPVPGAGPIYDPIQPGYLKMNFPAEQLDIWWPDGGVVPSDERLPFLAWRACGTEAPLTERYPPRAQVGRYLADGFARLIRHAPSNVEIELLRASVEGVRRDGSTWEVATGGSAVAGARRYDEILVATGHDRRPVGPSPEWRHAAPLIPAVFPVERWLAAERVPPGRTVAVRGFALTFIDAALALTEGRGGSFETLTHSYRLRYLGTPGQVNLILPFSRTGRPMRAKPDPGLSEQVPALADVTEEGRSRILHLGDGLDVRAHLLPIVASVAASSLLLANALKPVGEPLRALTARITTALEDIIRGVWRHEHRDAATDIECSLAVGCGASAPDRAWALGHSWRELYPAIVTRLSGHRLRPHDWHSFHRLAAEMERLAFGPPPVNAAKLLALVEAGVLDLKYLRGGRVETEDGTTSIHVDGEAHPVDLIVDAVLPGPGLRGHSNGLLGPLIADGHARILAGGRGVEVLFDGSCLGADGSITPGLAVVGRATEDSVIGNDTLSRTVHPLVDHWARRVAQRAHGAGHLTAIANLESA